MPDYEYVDEDGNPVDPHTLDGDYEIVEEIDEVVDGPTAATPAPAAQQPAAGGGGLPAPRMSKAVIAIGAAVVLGVGGVVAYGLSAIGGQNTISDVKEAASAKSSQAKAAVSSKKAEVMDDADACTASGLGSAMISGSNDPAMALNVLAAAPLPAAFVAAQTNAGGVTGQLGLLQLGKNTWGVYAEVVLTRAEKKAKTEKPGWWKADVTVDGDRIAVTGDREWPGGDDAGAGSCEPGKPGVYAVTGKVPADAAGLVDGQAEITAIQGIAGSETQAVAVMGGSVTLVELTEAPDDDTE